MLESFSRLDGSSGCQLSAELPADGLVVSARISRAPNAPSGEGPEGAALRWALRDRPDVVTGMRRELGLDDDGEDGDAGGQVRHWSSTCLNS